MDKCPITGAPCSNPKVIHITDVGKDYCADNAYDVCQVCAMKQEQPKAQLPPIIKNLFDLFALLVSNKIKQAQEQQQPPPQVPELAPPTPVHPIADMKPACPSCGTTIQDIINIQRLGCPHCYEHYKVELLPVLIHAHKSAEHVGKHPKHKGPVLEDMPFEEQVRVLEMQIKQAAEQEQYEKAGELKAKLLALKSSPQPE